MSVWPANNFEHETTQLRRKKSQGQLRRERKKSIDASKKTDLTPKFTRNISINPCHHGPLDGLISDVDLNIRFVFNNIIFILVWTFRSFFQILRIIRHFGAREA